MSALSSSYSARAVVALREPSAMLRTMCRHFEEHGEVSYDGRQGRMQISFGNARLEAGDTTLTLHAEGQNEINLSYMKWSLAEHLVDFARDDRPTIVWEGDHRAGQLLPFFREMRVVGARSITPMMRRLTLAGHDLQRFDSESMHVRLAIPPRGIEPQWPVMGADGRPQWPEGDKRLSVRFYTIRSIDAAAGTLDIDMVLHEGSAPGSDFARSAQPGDLVGMVGPSGTGVADADWYLFAGDETALPAIARTLETLPAHATAVVRIEVADRLEEQALSSPAALDLQYLHRNGVPAGRSTLLRDAVRDLKWPQDGRRTYAWSGSEHQDFKALRKFMRGEKALPRDQHMATGYWRLNTSGDH